MACTADVYERLGVFYLGRQYTGATSQDGAPVLYASKDLTTHGVCVGMTGSGKTGLCLGLLEEAAIDQIPIIAIDPKGDVCNLLLTFPELAPEQLAPWIDPAVAEREGVPVATVAEREASRLRDGLTSYGQDGERIRRLRDSVEMVIYTPGSQAGRPLSLLRSFAAPSPSQLQNPDVLREKVQGAVSGLLSLLGIDADPLRSRDHILLSQILDGAFRAGRDMTLADLIHSVQKPAFNQVGVFELDTFYPAKERLELAMALNNLLAAPGAQSLANGEPLEIESLLRSSGGKPKLSVISIAHLSDGERMAFVTTLLSELVVWMRGQSGTSSLRALLYMDEIFGYFPPTAAPPSKLPMLTLLKQARAFGLGVMLATQNPVDLDYKGLSNCGTWFIGRLQTERDKARVLDGLEGAATQSGQPFDRAEMDRLLSGLARRVFLMNNVHEGAPRLIETRSTLCYLRGPLTRDEISRLMHGDPRASLCGGEPLVSTTTRDAGAVPNGSDGTPAVARASSPPLEAPPKVSDGTSAVARASSRDAGSAPVAPRGTAAAPGIERDAIPAEAHEVFFPAFNRASGVTYRAGIYARAKLHFIDKKADVDVWRDVECWAPVEATDADPRWAMAEPVPPIVAAHVTTVPLADSHFAPLPATLGVGKRYAAFRKAFAAYLYQSEALSIRHSKALDLTALVGETDAQFTARLEQALRERRDLEMEELREDYRDAYDKLKSKLDKTVAKLERERRQASGHALEVALEVGGGLLGALLGRNAAPRRSAQRVRSASRRGAQVARARVEAEQAEQSRELLERAMAELEQEFQQESARLADSFRLENQVIEERRITPRKADIQVETLQLAWRPE